MEEPLFSAAELGGLIPVDSKKPFDIRKVEMRPVVVSYDVDYFSHCGRQRVSRI